MPARRSQVAIKAAETTVRARVWANTVRLWRGRAFVVRVVLVEAPLPDITVHVVEAEGVGFQLTYGFGAEVGPSDQAVIATVPHIV